MEHALFVVSNEVELARCAVFINRRWQRHHDCRAGFLGFFAAAPGAHQATAELLSRAENWLARRGATGVVAGYDGVCGTGLGFRTDEFHRAPRTPEPWHPPYYAKYLSVSGYRRFRPWLSWRFDLRSGVTRSMMDLVIRRRICTVRPIDRGRWTAELTAMQHVFNECFTDAWDYYPLTAEEMSAEMKDFESLADPGQVLFAEVDGEIAGICAGTPNHAPLLRELRGRMDDELRAGFLAAARRVREGTPSTLAVLPQYRGRHVGHTLLATLFQYYEDAGMTEVEAVFIDRDNTQMVGLLDSFGGEHVIRYHTFWKSL